ncbi:MAG: hypothetical protein ABSG81_09820 [Acidimicrobiales bacterium]|jgi:hypothetical protein
MTQLMRRHRDDRGLTTGVSLLAMTISLAIVAVLLLVSMNAFGGGTASGPGSQHSILSTSNAESQIKLCAEGRASTYGDPPTPAQQAKCLDQLAGQIGGTPSVPGSP